jgi:hypothetical protein
MDATASAPVGLMGFFSKVEVIFYKCWLLGFTIQNLGAQIAELEEK